MHHRKVCCQSKTVTSTLSRTCVSHVCGRRFWKTPRQLISESGREGGVGVGGGGGGGGQRDVELTLYSFSWRHCLQSLGDSIPCPRCLQSSGDSGTLSAVIR